ncbi:MAG: restriction endonuclease subunit S [Eubacterium sp.]|nr:restriction endonuclease subunit S [Eubacterium sp.]
MNLNLKDWKEFRISSVFTIHNGKGITKEEIDDHPGTFTVVQSGEENNGVLGKIDLEYCKAKNYVLSEHPCLTVARSGCAGYVSYQPDGCVVGDSAKLLILKSDRPSDMLYLFLQTVLSAIRLKYAYGRKVTAEKYGNDTINLPPRHNPDGTLSIDETHAYSAEGYVPDWNFMEQYMQSLRHHPLTTQNRPGNAPSLNIHMWKNFKLSDLFAIRYGVNLELNTCAIADKNEADSVNFVARTAENNGVTARVRLIPYIAPQKSGLISVAAGGSVLSTFYQDEPFYSGRDLYTLDAKEKLSPAAKLFMITIIVQNKYKYSYGRQANKTLPDLVLSLPIRQNTDGKPYIDANHTYSANGYIPDWEFMEKYMGSLPYGDHLM